MDENTANIISTAIMAITQLYALRATDFPLFAYVWDFIASITGWIANLFGNISVNARLAYFEAVQT